MTSETSSILIIAGAVMAFVTSNSAGAIYIQSLGAIAMAAGGFGLAASVHLKPIRLPRPANFGGQVVSVRHNRIRGRGPALVPKRRRSV